MFRWGKTPICLDAHETYYSFGAHSPNIVQEKLRSWQLVCLPTLHLLSLDCLRRGFRRTPTNHTMRLTWTLLTMPSLNYTVEGTLTFLHTQNKETICIVLSFDQRDIGFSVLIILTNLWKLMRLPEGPFYTTSQFSNAVSNQPSPFGGTPWAGSRISLPILGKVINCYNGLSLNSVIFSYSLLIL